MKSFDSTFQERMKRAADAKQKALDQLRAKPPVDEALLTARRDARLAREAAAAEKRAAKEEEKKRVDAEKAAQAAAAKRPEPTEAERKAARDERYAARKKRK
jgi:hypothetical protein